MLRLTNKVDVGPGASVQAGKEQGRRTHQTHPTSHYTTIILCPGKQTTHTHVHIHETQRQRKRWRVPAVIIKCSGRRVCWHTSECTHSAASERKIRRCVYMICGSQAQLPDARRVRSAPHAKIRTSHPHATRLPCPHSGGKFDWSAADRREVQPCHEFFRASLYAANS